MSQIIQILLIIMLMLQIIVLLHMFIMNIKRNKDDKKFWDTIAKEEQTVLDSLRQAMIHVPLDNPNTKEETGSEQQNKDENL